MKTIELRLSDKLESTMRAFIQLKSEISSLSDNKSGLFQKNDSALRKIGQMDDDICDMMMMFGEIIGTNIFENAVNDSNEQ